MVCEKQACRSRQHHSMRPPGIGVRSFRVECRPPDCVSDRRARVASKRAPATRGSADWGPGTGPGTGFGTSPGAARARARRSAHRQASPRPTVIAQKSPGKSAGLVRTTDSGSDQSDFRNILRSGFLSPILEERKGSKQIRGCERYRIPSAELTGTETSAREASRSPRRETRLTIRSPSSKISFRVGLSITRDPRYRSPP